MNEQTTKNGGTSDNLNSLVSFEVGQVWQTSRGCLWHVTSILATGQAVLTLGGYGRSQFQQEPPRLWRMIETNSSISGKVSA